MAVERIIGIDFGTSTSVIRVKRYENGKTVGEKLEVKEVVFGGKGTTVPTLIQKKDDNESIVYYGYDAQQKRKKTTTYHSFKMDLESDDLQKREQARALTEEFFRYLASVYKAQSNGGFLGEPGDQERTIVSYPVKWNRETRKFMVDVATRAGFPNVSGMDEAQAAIRAVAVMNEDYLRTNNLLVNGMPSNILLVDMGAGTTDLVLCRYTPGKEAKADILKIWPKAGELLFGGREVDSLLQTFFRNLLDVEDAKQVFKRIGVEKFKAWKEENVSPALIRGDSVSDFEALDQYLEDHDMGIGEYCLDRTAFEECLFGYLNQLPELINGCLESANFSGRDIDLVIVTGGHSQWYFVKEMLAGKMPQYGKLELTKISGDSSRIIQVARPQETVAIGLCYSSINVIIQGNYFDPVIVNRGGKINFLETAGKPISSHGWEAAGSFSNRLAAVRKNGKWGYININGDVVIDYRFDKAHLFCEGYAAVQKNGKWAYINKEGILIVDYLFDEANMFHNGFATVRKGNKWSFIGIDGKVRGSYKWDWIYPFEEKGTALARMGKDKYFTINSDGANLGEFKY